MMTARRFSNTFLSLLLVAALLAMRLNTLSTEFFVTPCQDFLKSTPTIYSESAHTKPGFPMSKPKRAGDLDFSIPASLAPITLVVQYLSPFFPFVAVPEVYLDIFVPPEGRA